MILGEDIDHKEFDLDNKMKKAKLKFVLKTPGQKNQIKDTYINITEPENLWNNIEYKKNQPLVIFISGFTTNLREENSPSHDALANAYVKFRRDVNFVVN